MKIFMAIALLVMPFGMHSMQKPAQIKEESTHELPSLIQKTVAHLIN